MKARKPRIKPEIKAIADAHIQAKKTNRWDNPHATTRQEVVDFLLAGKTHQQVLEQVETKFCSIGSIVFANMGYDSQNYVRDVRRGFEIMLNPYFVD